MLTSNPQRLTSTLVALLVALTVATLVCVAQAEDDPAAAAYREAYKLVLEEKWPEASKAMAAVATTYGQSAWADDAQFWLCYGQEKQGGDAVESLESTFGCYLSLVRQRPSSDWADDGKRALARLAGALAERGRPQYRDQLGGLDAGPDESLFAVLRALAEIGDDRAVTTLVTQLGKADDPRTREQIVRILGQVESPTAAKALRDVLERDPSPDVRVAALRSISEQAGPEAVRFLGALAADPKQPVELRRAALRSLGEQDDPAVVELLAGVARGKDPDLAEAAIRALGEHGDSPEVWKALRSLLESTSEDVREAAFRAIAEIGGPEAVKELRAGALAGSTFAARRLGEVGEEAVPVLREIVTQAKDPEVRRAALRGLAETGDPAVVAILGEVAKGSDPELRSTAVRALAETGDAAAVAVLVDLAKTGDPGVRRDAARALGEIGTPEARDALIDLLGDGR